MENSSKQPTQSNQPNKLVVISGGSRGIGKALVSQFLSQGLSVHTASRQQETLQSLTEEMKGLYGENVPLHTFSADLSQKKEITAFAQTLPFQKDQEIILVNNAGTFLPGAIHAEEEGILEKLIETNLYSAYYLSRACMPYMIKAKKGYIFNIGSTAGKHVYPNGSSYCISKFAMRGLSLALREELKPYGIRVSDLLPGPTLTDLWKDAGGDLPPASYFIAPEDIAQIVWDTYNLPVHTNVEEIVIRPQKGDI